MREIKIRSNEAGQRLDKFLHKYMKEAPSSFFYKMMRKKNIVLNQNKCTGSEKLQEGDILKLFFSEETFISFGAPAVHTGQGGKKEQTANVQETAGYLKALRQIGPLPVCYEDEHILAVNKPAGILTQKADPKDISLNEWLIGYLLEQGEITAEGLLTFKPSVCNRLDRNTSGLVLCGKSLVGTQFLSACLQERSLQKFYRLWVAGTVKEAACLEAFLIKDEKTNQVQVLPKASATAAAIKTGIEPLAWGTLADGTGITYAQAELFTGKTHQIRAHLASVGHPLLGDMKYGDSRLNRLCQTMGCKSQLLHAYCVRFPQKVTGPCAGLAGKTIYAKEPKTFDTIKENCNGNLEFKRAAGIYPGGSDQSHQ